MERVRKTFFNPLATTKAAIRAILEGLPVGSAHPFSPERILLCRTEHGIDEIDISSYPEDFFFNAVDLGEMGEVLLRRMAGFKNDLGVFDDFQILQAPASTFKIPIMSGQITILTVTERTPTYYDFCFADAFNRACCWTARKTFPGIAHSGDITNGKDLTHYAKMDRQTLTENQEFCVFISGYNRTKITKFLGTHPALLVADHVDKVLYLVPVPLDAATIGDATICCPLVIKRDGGSLVCSILPTATTDVNLMCHGSTISSPCFKEAINRADFTISTVQSTATPAPAVGSIKQDMTLDPEIVSKIMAKENAVFATPSVTLPSSIDVEKTQIVKFGTSLEFKLQDQVESVTAPSSTVILPSIFGSQLEGPLLLATGTVAINVPFIDENALRGYYEQLKAVTVIVNDRMTDNARNVATSWRLNALFIVQLNPKKRPKTSDEVMALLDSANINAVTALAGPQSLIVAQILDKYYFYRGIANREYLNTTKLAFGSDITSVIESVGAASLMEPMAKRIVNLNDANAIILPTSGQLVLPGDLKEVLDGLGIDQVQNLGDDISAAVPQLQMLLNQKDLSELSKALVSALSTKVSDVTAPMRKAYIKHLTQEHEAGDQVWANARNRMLGELRKATAETQKALEPVISSLANLMSSQTSSRRTHDLKRLVRQAQIQGNVEATKSMTFETISGYLESYAADMGVMMLNIETTPYLRLLSGLKGLNLATIDASTCCDLDSRVLHLEGFDAGIIMEQSQSQHNGPLRSQNGPTQPIVAVPYLNQARGHDGSMLAWVCWDEFVNLKNPYSVRWMEKCNEAHIAALRIITRSTLSDAVASREFDIAPGSPETGHLMSALLMAAMSKLAAMRTTAPTVLDTAEDTVTRLMRGLFGNLLTIAGSGVRPLSMVWQLFGLNPSYDIPTTDADWIWYETAVALYPYTCWPLKQFHDNLARLLDKAIIRVVTKGEKLKDFKASRMETIINYSKLRNIQLDHSRTIITVFMRMLTAANVDMVAVAKRLLEQLPKQLERQTNSYGVMIKYLEHLANGGQRRPKDDLVAASVYTKRSAGFAQLKRKVSEACVSRSWPEVKESCQVLVDKHVEIATLWGINAKSLNLQNMKVYKDLLQAELGDSEEISPDTMSKNLDLTRIVLGDAEKWRVPWQVGKEGQYSDKIEPLDEAFLHQVLTGETLEGGCMVVDGPTEAAVEQPAISAAVTQEAEKTIDDEFAEFKSALQPSFISAMQKGLSAEDACRVINVPVKAMKVFVKALNPEFVWEDLGWNFKLVVLELLKNRSNREESSPFKKVVATGREEEAGD